MARFNIDGHPNFPLQADDHLGVLGVIAEDPGRLVYLSLQSFGSYFQCNLSLASRRDSTVKPGNAATSARLDLLNIQRLIAAVKNPKIMSYSFPLGYLIEAIGRLLHFNDWSELFFPCGYRQPNAHRQDYTRAEYPLEPPHGFSSLTQDKIVYLADISMGQELKKEQN